MFQINDSLWKSLELHRMREALQGFEKNEIPLTENKRKDLTQRFLETLTVQCYFCKKMIVSPDYLTSKKY